MPRRPPDEFDQRIGRTIRIYRRMRRMTQADLGTALGISPQQVQKLETGRNRLAVSCLFQISAALRIPIDFFFVAALQETA